MSTSASVRPILKSIVKLHRPSHVPPTFLLPSFLGSSQQASPFSSTSSYQYPRDMNRARGVSTTKRSGLRQPLSVSKTPLPQPILDASKRSKVEVDDDHGLWQFFHSKDKPMNTPEEDYEHGRPWCSEELRGKSWEDLHALWWECVKERNRIATESYERTRLNAGYGEHESQRRDITVRRTMRAIKHVLTERFYQWQDAQEIAKNDAEINLDARGDVPVYTPSEFMDEDVFEDLEVAGENTDSQQKRDASLEQDSKQDQRPSTTV